MRYQCAMCGEKQWRGFFPQETFHIRWTVFHGIAVGICGIATREVFKSIGWSTEGWRNGLKSLGVCLLFLLAYYGIALTIEAMFVRRCKCHTCGERELRSN